MFGGCWECGDDRDIVPGVRKTGALVETQTGKQNLQECHRSYAGIYSTDNIHVGDMKKGWRTLRGEGWGTLPDDCTVISEDEFSKLTWGKGTEIIKESRGGQSKATPRTVSLTPRVKRGERSSRGQGGIVQVGAGTKTTLNWKLACWESLLWAMGSHWLWN